MRYVIILILSCACAFAQTDSPQEQYERGLNALAGSDWSRDNMKAFDLIQSAAKSGYVPAEVTMGLLYDGGSQGGSSETAAYWYRKAAEQGDVLAQWLLGRILVLGYANGPSDGDEWLQKAADAGNPFGAYLLALDLEADRPEDAMPLFKQAAEQGLPYAQYRLGVALRDGRGTKQDKFEAYVWLLLSASKLKIGSNPLSFLESDLGAADVQRAKTEARKRDEKVRRTVNAGGCTWKGALAEIPTPPPIEVQQFCEPERPIKVFEDQPKAEQ